MVTPNRFLKMVFLNKKNESRIFNGKYIITKNAGFTTIVYTGLTRNHRFSPHCTLSFLKYGVLLNDALVNEFLISLNIIPFLEKLSSFN